MGAVFRVFDRVGGRVVALKTLHGSVAGIAAPGEEALDRKRFEREIRALAALSHRGIVRIHDVGLWGGRPYFTMECLLGVPLQAFLDRPLPDPGEIDWLLR